MSKEVSNQERLFLRKGDDNRKNVPFAATTDSQNAKILTKSPLPRVVFITLFFLFLGLAVYFAINAPVTWQSEEEDAHNMLPAILCLILALISISLYPSKKLSQTLSSQGPFINNRATL